MPYTRTLFTLVRRGKLPVRCRRVGVWRRARASVAGRARRYLGDIRKLRGARQSRHLGARASSLGTPGQCPLPHSCGATQADSANRLSFHRFVVPNYVLVRVAASSHGGRRKEVTDCCGRKSCWSALPTFDGFLEVNRSGDDLAA